MVLKLTEKQKLILASLIDQKNLINKELELINLRQKEIAELILDFNDININDVVSMDFTDGSLTVKVIEKNIEAQNLGEKSLM